MIPLIPLMVASMAELFFDLYIMQCMFIDLRKDSECTLPTYHSLISVDTSNLIEHTTIPKTYSPNSAQTQRWMLRWVSERLLMRCTSSARVKSPSWSPTASDWEAGSFRVDSMSHVNFIPAYGVGVYWILFLKHE